MIRKMLCPKTGIVEKSKFFVGEKKPRKARHGHTTLAKKDRNATQAVRRLARVLNCNFDAGDLLITLTYEDEALPSSPAEASRQVLRFIRRLKRAGLAYRGVWITADKDKNGSTKRLHHHMVLDGSQIRLQDDGSAQVAYVGEKKLEDIWGQGFVKAKHVEDERDHTGLADYLVRQAADEPNQKKWHTSAGLDKAVLLEEKIVAKDGELRAPGGAEVLEVGHYDAETGSHYIRYIPKEKPEKTGGDAGKMWDEPKINEYGLKGWRLPRPLYERARGLVRDYPRFKAEHEAMLIATPDREHSPGRSGPGDPTGTTAIRREQLGADVDAVEKAMDVLPEEYIRPIYKNIAEGVKFPDYGSETMWGYWKRKFLYHVAQFRGY